MNSIIISPSGNLYGSEQVLLDYLNLSTLKHKIYLPAKSLVEKYFKNKNVVFKKFFNLSILYSYIIIDLVFKNYQIVYINEAGHSIYISFLAKLFKQKKFYVHIRLLEDCDITRFPFGHLSNMEFITVSEYIASKFPYKSIVLHDGYNFSKNIAWNKQVDGVIKIGIIGRITKSKGFDVFKSLFNTIAHLNIEIHFFGDISQDVNTYSYLQSLPNFDKIKFHGFVTSRDEIYSRIDLVLHLNKQEPLGRIFFEALDYGVPIIGFRCGGIGEIANTIHYPNLVVDEFSNFNQHVLSSLVSFTNILKNKENDFEIAREMAMQYFSAANYTRVLDKLFQ